MGPQKKAINLFFLSLNALTSCILPKENASLPPFAEKIKDMFGAKIISHEQRDKGKG